MVPEGENTQVVQKVQTLPKVAGYQIIPSNGLMDVPVSCRLNSFLPRLTLISEFLFRFRCLGLEISMVAVGYDLYGVHESTLLIVTYCIHRHTCGPVVLLLHTL